MIQRCHRNSESLADSNQFVDRSFLVMSTLFMDKVNSPGTTKIVKKTVEYF